MKKYILISSLVITLSLVAFLNVKANSAFFLPTITTATATSSPAYLSTSGANASATTTLDAYTNGVPRAADKATILVQYVASSTSSVFTSRVEYSQDGIDWYSDSINVSTTSSAVNIASTRTYTFTAPVAGTSSKAFTVQTPTRYMRVVHTVAGAAGAAWTQIVPTREAIQ